MCISNEKVTNKLEVAKEEDDREANFRVYGVLAYFIVLVVLGLPIWWFTTRVYRASLPLSQVDELEIITGRADKEFGIPLSLEYDVLVSIVHPDPEGITIDLDGEFIDENLQQLLAKFSSIADFVVKSQWLYLTELGVRPQKILGHHFLSERELPHVITPLETKIWSNISPRPTLNFIIYFPKCGANLHIQSADNKKIESNAFLSPRWGGILVMNPDETSCQTRKFKPDIQTIVSTLATQLKRLFKVSNASNPESILELKTRKALEMLDSTRRTLKSLSQLLSEISSIVISDEVGEKINSAVENAASAESFLQRDMVDEGLKYAKSAFFNSEAAFSDPSLLALLYFPEDQKYAVYIPLFLPIMIPVFMSLTIVVKWSKLRKKKTD